MAKIDFYTISKAEKEAIFNSIATEKGMTPFAVEKDWWVSRTLGIIFNMDIAKHMVFKGGTSLSKAWKLINRFSEDIDLIIDKEFFFKPEKTWSKKEITKLRKQAGIYSTTAFFEELQVEFRKKGFRDLKFIIVDADDSDQDPRIIEIYYPNIIKFPAEYVSPKVQIEIGCRSLREPFTFKKVGALVDEVYAGRDFAEALFEVPTVNPERTFLEKLFLLHEEFQRPAEKMRVNRLSRHLYDLYQLTINGVAVNALSDKELYETIVAHRYKFAKVGSINYNLHSPHSIHPIPGLHIDKAWQEDYEKMKQEMIFDTYKPTYEQLIQNLNHLKTKLNNVNWNFELSFPIPKT
jgi:hypothetical protein